MGCSQSRKKSNLCKRISSYQIESYREETENLNRRPRSFSLYDLDQSFRITVQQFHNLFFDGFYCPYIKNPHYLLIIDTRTEEAFRRKHVATAKWCGMLSANNIDYSLYTCIVVYDEDGLSFESCSRGGGSSKELLRFLRGRNLNPRCIAGGFAALEKTSFHIWNSLTESVRRRIIVLHWYPSIILESFLYLGRTDQALNPVVIKDMKLTHIVCLTHTVPVRVFSFIDYLVLPLHEEKDQDLLQNINRIIEFIDDAATKGGRILVHCEQGVNRGAAVVMGYLMHYKSCTLEDAYDYVSHMRTVALDSSPLLAQLSTLEEQIFGRKLTNIKELW